MKNNGPPEVFAKLRCFYEKRNDIHIIAAGSRLDFILADHTFSMPVGRIEYLSMGPMTFMEFLKACEENPLYDLIKQYRISEIIPDPIHQKILDFLRSYISVGGMPSVLQEYIESKSAELCERELSSLLITYRDDFSKYGRKIDPYRLQMVLDRVPGIIGRKVKFTEISREEKSINLKTALQQLKSARILYQVHHSSANGIPLRAEKKESF
jgi:predicted AAA+ superfamily ATPase